MAALMAHPRLLWRKLFRPISPGVSIASTYRVEDSGPSVEISFEPHDPVLAYFREYPGVSEVDHLPSSSSAVHAMRAAGIELVIPLVSQGEVLGVVSLGRRMSGQEYSIDDRALLANLATQAAPAVRVAQLVRQQQAEADERQRLAREMQIARLIQQSLLPRDVPHVPGYDVRAHYQPAREVGGDFYDFLALDDGRLGFVVGDVTDKGVPAALVMATTRSVVRGVAATIGSPGGVLARANDLLCPDVPMHMFVTCFYAILDPRTGHIVFANAGHDLPYRQHGSEAYELRARGMPLGLLPGMEYEEKEARLEMGDMLVFYSDGIAEAHNPGREMFGFPRVRDTVAGFRAVEGSAVVDHLLHALAEFTGPAWEQEDDITVVSVRCLRVTDSEDGEEAAVLSEPTVNDAWELLAQFEVPSSPGNERVAIRRVMEVLAPVALSQQTAERLKTAIGEVTMNAMEHGNAFDENMPVRIQVARAAARVAVRITDRGRGAEKGSRENPDLDAKLAGLQSPRGWGLFLIEHMVDHVSEYSDERDHTIELIANVG